MSLLDLQLAGGRYTWREGDKHDIAARLDRFLVSDEWNGGFKNIKQSILQKTEGFLDRVKEWWMSFDCEGWPDFILAF